MSVPNLWKSLSSVRSLLPTLDRTHRYHQRFPTLTLDRVYAAILYYLSNRPLMDAYLTDWLDWGYRVREEQRQNPPAFVASLAALREEREKYRAADS